MPQNQPQPISYRRSAVNEVQMVRQEPGPTPVIHLGAQVKELQDLSSIPAATALRRFLFVWFRVYVLEKKHGKQEKVNVRIPLPIPFVGVMFQRQLSLQKAAKLAAQARRGEDVSETLESTMGLEFVRVQEEHPERNKSTLVVVGLD